MMMPNKHSRDNSYVKFKNEKFKKYTNKIDAIIININQTSLKDHDKVVLKRKLIQKLIESI